MLNVHMYTFVILWSFSWMFTCIHLFCFGGGDQMYTCIHVDIEVEWCWECTHVYIERSSKVICTHVYIKDRKCTRRACARAREAGTTSADYSKFRKCRFCPSSEKWHHLLPKRRRIECSAGRGTQVCRCACVLVRVHVHTCACMRMRVRSCMRTYVRAYTRACACGLFVLKLIIFI